MKDTHHPAIKKIAAIAAEDCSYCGPLKNSDTISGTSTYVFGFEHAKATKVILDAITQATSLLAEEISILKEVVVEGGVMVGEQIVRAEKAEAEIESLQEQRGMQLAACDCAATMDTKETHEGNKTVTRGNPYWSPAFESVMRRTAECIKLRADNEALRETLDYALNAWVEVQRQFTGPVGKDSVKHVIDEIAKLRAENAALRAEVAELRGLPDYNKLQSELDAARAAIAGEGSR
jgi:hypothetical protein